MIFSERNSSINKQRGNQFLFTFVMGIREASVRETVDQETPQCLAIVVIACFSVSSSKIL
ncbi:hypothetical protein GVanDAA622_13300 [Enterococcus faecium]|nr:hypothetical protein GVanDAA622_13300 [Enterococcus faecium]